MEMMPALSKGGRLGFPGVPFTFPSIGFSSAAKKLGYDIGWFEGGEIYGLYRDGVLSGAIKKPGNTMDAIKYLESQGIEKFQAAGWLDTASRGIEAGSWNTTMLYPTGGFVSDLMKALGEEIGSVVKGGGEGLLDSAGIALGKLKKPAMILGAATLIIAAAYTYNSFKKPRSS